MAKRVLITGCSTGIGRACAVQFAGSGYEVIATARHLGAIADLDVAERMRLDVTKNETIQAVAARVGTLDVLINNAGSSLWGPVEEVPVDDAKDLFDTNVWGSMRVFQAFVPSMRRAGSGRVINVSSLAANSGGPMLGFYSASKAALSRLSEAMHREVERDGVTVAAIELAGVESNFPLNRIVIECSDPGYRNAFEQMQARIAQSRSTAVSSEQVAKWIMDIAEEENPAIRYMVSLDQQLSRAG